MEGYPDPDEEFELMYQDDFEALRDLEESCNNLPVTQDKEIEQTTQKDCDLNDDIVDIDTIEAELDNTPSVVTTADCSTSTCNVNTDVNSPKKRSIQELFGEIDDILSEEIVEGRIVKRKKKENADDWELINRIVELRKLAKLKQNNVAILSNNSALLLDTIDKDNISYTVPRYSFVAITQGNGDRVYVRCHSEEYMKEELSKISKDTFKGVMGDAFKNIWEEAKLQVNKQLDLENSNVPMDVEVSATDDPKQNKIPDSSLWVDLYKPQKYFELLSDEFTNRTLLQWLKLWDRIVFKRKAAPKMINSATKKPFKKFNFKRPELNTELDENGFPANKVALLCGPPGLGKTTLAHIIATHAGYNVVEVNASDDRTPEKFSELLKTATQMEAVIDPKKRPNCLIFDEIDGAPSSAIDFLVKFIMGGITEKKKKGAKKGHVLKRPIICICNDVYVPALRPLRQIAFVLNFPPTQSVRLAERLSEIARNQRINIDLGALLALCEKTENDIRSCLGALHFFKTLSKRITTTQVSNTNIGQKDVQKALFAVWQTIFLIKQPKIVTNDNNNHYDGSLKSRMNHILGVVSSFGDYEKVAQGVYENYPKLNIRDASFSNICEAMEWFCYSDLLNTQIYTLQDYSLLTYLPYSFVVWHFVFGSSSWQKLAYPSAGYEAKTKTFKNVSILSEVIKGMQPTIRAYTCPNSLKMDTLPLLSNILVPAFRPVNMHLYTQEEKTMVENVTNIMIDYNLSYEQERKPDGTYVFNIEPNIDEVVQFSTSKPSRVMSYFNRHMIARNIETEKLKRADLFKNKGESKESSSGKTSTSKTTKTKEASPTVPNHLQRLKPKTVSPKGLGATVAKDFFGRIVSKPTTANTTANEAKTDIWYQYKEGYSNAVRKQIKISSLE